MSTSETPESNQWWIYRGSGENMIGRRVGAYQIVEELGRGGLTTVYRATDTVLARDVALKVLHPQLSANEAMVERFRRIEMLAGRLNHPNIVPIYHVGQDGQVSYIATKLLSGWTLEHTIQERGRIALSELLPIVEQIASALDYAHAQNIVHRDIKPANVMLEPSGQALLTDFMLARLLDDTSVTPAGAVIGTPTYIAPEQIRGNPIDARADVYGFGIMVFYCLTGQQPFTGGSPIALLFKHVNESPPTPSMVVPGLTAAIDAAILMAMAKNPAERYQSAGAFWQALRDQGSADATQLPSDMAQM